MTDKNVNRQQFLSALADCSLLHFAGHGFYEGEQGMTSGIQLHGKEVVNVTDLMNQSIRTDLVVLSACEMGLHCQLSQRRTGEFDDCSTDGRRIIHHYELMARHRYGCRSILCSVLPQTQKWFS